MRFIKLIAVLACIAMPAYAQDEADSEPGFNEATFKGLEFRSVGPAFMSGRIADIVIDPNDPSTWYVAVGSGGVWKTVNAGTTWEAFSQTSGMSAPLRLRKHETEGFASPSGKLDFYIQQYADWGYDPLPDYVEPDESPESDPGFVERYPLVLTTGQRILNFFGSDHRYSDYLRKSHPDPVADIHPDTAAQYGIKDKAWMHIESPRGKVKFKANVTEKIIPGVVAAEFAWWFPEKGGPDYGWQQSNINLLTDDKGKLDPGMGATALKGLMCCVSKA